MLFPVTNQVILTCINQVVKKTSTHTQHISVKPFLQQKCFLNKKYSIIII